MNNLAICKYKKTNYSIDAVAQTSILSKMDVHKLIIENRSFLMNFIMKRAWDKQAVQDIFQSTVLEVLKSFIGFQGHASPRTWMFGIAMNMIKAHAKKANLTKSISIDDIEEIDTFISHSIFGEGDCENPSDICEREQWMRSAIRVFRKFPDEMRITFNEVVNNGKTYEQVANLLSVPVGTVRSRVSRARDILRTATDY